MYSTSGEGWAGATYTVYTNGTARESGTLDGGYDGVAYMCLEDGVHAIEVTGASDEDGAATDDSEITVGVCV